LVALKVLQWEYSPVFEWVVVLVVVLVMVSMWDKASMWGADLRVLVLGKACV
jgi:hypothetical protein